MFRCGFVLSNFAFAIPYLLFLGFGGLF